MAPIAPVASVVPVASVPPGAPTSRTLVLKEIDTSPETGLDTTANYADIVSHINPQLLYAVIQALPAQLVDEFPTTMWQSHIVGELFHPVVHFDMMQHWAVCPENKCIILYETNKTQGIDDKGHPYITRFQIVLIQS